jgi:hypothetical protein
MKLSKLIANAPSELGPVEVEVMELLSRVRGALGWDVSPEGKVRVEYDAERISARTLSSALRGLGFEPVPVPVRARYSYPLRRSGSARR